jgi:hypothetical protein
MGEDLHKELPSAFGDSAQALTRDRPVGDSLEQRKGGLRR